MIKGAASAANRLDASEMGANIMPLKAQIVMLTKDGTWIQDMDLPFPPFPGLGIRIDTYEILNVDSVVVGDARCDVTCIVHLEGVADENITKEKCLALGFEKGVYV